MAVPARVATAPTQAGVGLSTLHDGRAAGADAVRRACAALTTPPQVCLVFAGATYPQAALLAGIQAAAPGARIVGCSGEGVIAGPQSEERDRVVAVMALASTAIDFAVLSRADYAAAPEDAATGLAAAIRATGDDAFAVLLLTDGLGGQCSRFLATLQAALPADLPVIGGAAGDAMSFTGTYQYLDDQVLSGGAVALVLRGAGHIRHAVSHGCVPVGGERTVTDAGDGWVRTIDGQPAWTVLKEYLDGDPVDLNAEGIVHLCFGAPLTSDSLGDYDPYIIRTPMQLDPGTGALFFPGGGFATGDRLRLTRRDPDRIRSSAERCAASLLADRPPAFVVQFDCAGRGRILFGGCAAAQIVAPLQRMLGESVPWIGFHTYGEIAPVGGQLHYHNYTVALCAVYDG